jgi:hypothetical protein
MGRAILSLLVVAGVVGGVARADHTKEDARATPVVDPLASLIIHAFTIPFDPQEREAHLRDIPKNAKELDAHLRRLDAALRAKHATRD